MSDRMGTSVEGLRSYGERVADKADQAKALELGRSYSAAVLPESETAKSVLESGELLGVVADHAHGRLSFAGSESKIDADNYQNIEEHGAEQLQTVGESVENIGKFRW